MDSGRPPSRLGGAKGDSGRGHALCPSVCSGVAASCSRPSMSMSSSGICTRGRNGPWSVLLVQTEEEGATLLVCTSSRETGSVLRELRVGRR